MEPSPNSKRKCHCCSILFLPSPNNRGTQRFCSAAVCRKASKARSDAAWRRKNPDHHRGPEQVERVRQWRAKNPGYSRRGKRKKVAVALQDFAPTQGVENQVVAREEPTSASDFAQKEPAAKSCNAPGAAVGGGALQDFAYMQNPLVVGLIATICGEALQESFVPFAQKLLERGRRELAQIQMELGLHPAA